MDVSKLIQLKADEEVMMVVHQYLLPWWPKWVLALLWVILPFFLMFPLFQMRTWGVAIFIVLLLSGGIYMLRVFLSWYRSVFVITDRRLIDLDQRGLFHRVVSEVPYRCVQDVAYTIKGVFGTIFRYGDVRVQIKGNDVHLEIFHVYRPALVHDLINDLREEHEIKPDIIHP